VLQLIFILLPMDRLWIQCFGVDFYLEKVVFVCFHSVHIVYESIGEEVGLVPNVPFRGTVLKDHDSE
jgi:hypothetical protein